MSLTAPFRWTPRSAALLVSLLMGGLSACETSTDPIPPSGTFFVLNADPEVADLRMQVDNIPAPFTLDRLPFGYFCCQDDTGNPTYFVRESDEPRAVRFSSLARGVFAGTDLVVSRDSIYFFVVARHPTDVSQSTVLLFKNDVAPPASDRAKVRVVHLAPAIEPTGGPSGTIANVDVYLTAKDVDITTIDPTLANVVYGEVRTHAVIAPPTDTLRVRITRAGTKTVIVDLDRKFETNPGGGFYFGVQSINTVFVLNNSVPPFRLPARALVVNGL